MIDAYRALSIGEKFFTRMFDLLAGNVEIRRMIIDGDTPEQIRQSCKPTMWRTSVSVVPHICCIPNEAG